MPIIPAYNNDNYIQKLTDMVGQLRQDVDQLIASSKVNQLNYSSLNDTALPIYGTDPDGVVQLKARLGRQPDGTYAITYHNGDVLPNPIGIGVAERQLGILITWDGKFAGNAPKPADFLRLDIYISTVSGFTPSINNLYGSLFSPSALFIGADTITHYVKVAAVNTSEVASFPSFEVAVTPLPASSIAAESVTAVTLESELIMVSTMIFGSLFASHIRIDPVNGMIFYATDGTTPTLTLDLITGSASFTGNVQTQIGNDKVVITNLSGNPEIQLFRTQSPDRAYITAVGDSTNSTIKLVEHSGPDTITTPNRETRLILDIQQAEIVYADRPAGSNRGGHLFIGRNTNFITVRNANGSGAVDGGYVETTNSGVFAQSFTGGSANSSLDLKSNGQALLHAETNLDLSGTQNIRIGTNGRLRLHGSFGDMINDGIDADEAFFTGEAFFAYPGGITWTGGFIYGPTMLTAPRPIINVDGQPECKWTSYGASTTGFRFVTDSNIGRYVRFIAVRV
jgi:hypothetical protein